MRKVVYLVASTLDGKIADPSGGFECFALAGDAHFADYLNSLREFDAVLMGKDTYEVGLRQGITDPYPYLKSYVFSSTLPPLDDKRVELVREPASDFVRNLKADPVGGDIYLCGGAKLAAALLADGLVDEVHLKLNPILLGDGIPLVANVSEPTLLELLEQRAYPNGVLLLKYRVRR